MEIPDIENAILAKEKELSELRFKLDEKLREDQPFQNNQSSSPKQNLTHGEIARYSRQLILPELGVTGQLLLKGAQVLIVGCGGLGCPAAVYLAAAGIGTIGLLDYDTIDLSNLHRQVLHTEARVNVSKVDSILLSVKALNSNVNIRTHNVVLNSSTAIEIIKQYDVVLDCTDNVATRYLLNDSCVLSGKPLVSGAALRWEGQLTVYNYNDGPCYRCLFPSPPPPETVTNCSDGGVMGVIPGIIGSMQALETIKIIANIGLPMSCSMLLYDGFRSNVRKVKIRPKQKNCSICGETPSITELVDYEEFCGANATDKDEGLTLLQENHRVTVELVNKMLEENEPHVLVDVRMPVELEICSLGSSALNIPLKQISKPENLATIRTSLADKAANTIICVCRRGNDSQLAVRALAEAFKDEDVVIKDVVGGLTAWAKRIDCTMPIY